MKKKLALLIIFIFISGCGGGASSDNSAPATHTAVLTWDPPLEKMDGTALSPGEITEYKVYYGTFSSTYSTPISVPASDCSLECTLSIDGLSSGTYYFSIVARDSSGNESGYAEEISHTY